MTTAAPVLSPMSARRTAVIGGLMVAAGPLSITLYAPALPTMVADLGTTEAMAKLTLSVYFAAFALAQLLCGPLSDRFGRRVVAMAFFAIYVLGSLIAATAPGIEVLLAGRALQGIGVSAGVALSRAMVRDQFVGRDAVGILTMVNLILTVAPAIAPTLGSVLLLVGNWHLLFVVMAGFGLAIIAMLSLGARETHPPIARSALSPRTIVRNYGRLLGSLQFVLPALVLALAFGGFYGFSALLPFLLLDDLGQSTFQFAMTMLIQTGSFIAGNLAAGWCAKRLSGQSMVRIGLVLILLAGAGFGIAPRLFPASVLAVMVPVGLWMLALAFIGPSTTAAAMAPFGAIAGAAGALTGFFQMGGGFIGSMLASVLFVDARSATITLLPIIALLVACVALMQRISARPVAETPPET